MNQENLKRTPLFEKHAALKAKLAPFGGWEMPIQYSGIIEEYYQCRNSVALFDTCHMGEFYFKGDTSSSGFENAVTVPVTKLSVGKCRYGFLLNDQGGVIDDLIVYRLSDDEWMIVVNAATYENDFNIIQTRLKNNPVFVNQSEKTAKLDIQGPLSKELVMEKLNPEIGTLGYFQFKKMQVLGKEVLVSRTGYTGEMGFEVYTDGETINQIWDILMKDSRVKPAGLGARDVLRLEMGYSLYGSDLDEKTTPVEADLESFIDYTKDFFGKKALLEQKEKGVQKIKTSFKTLSRRAPRHDYDILKDGKLIGTVTSGTFSPALNSGIGMGYVDAPLSAGTKIVLKKEKVEIEAEVTKMPFYLKNSLKK